jgi:hypothetical protein
MAAKTMEKRPRKKATAPVPSHTERAEPGNFSPGLMDRAGPRFASVVTLLGKFLRLPYVVFVLGALLGGAYFATLFELHIVDPTFTEWLMRFGDAKQHFVGWELYRNGEWTMPLGTITQLAYPFNISLTYMDSIPLMAIPFKLFSSMLPEHFQYFGMWGLLCYMLQGGIAAMIIRRWTNNIFIILLGATVFIVSPMLASRMFVHTALASHWVILASIWALLERDKLNTTKRFVIAWSALFILAATIHPYFLPMVALPFAITIILTHTTWIATAIRTIVPISLTLGIFWLIGGFAVKGGDVVSEGLGDYAFNLNSLYNPLGWSQFLMPIKNASTSVETLNYLGAGVLLLIPVVIYTWLRSTTQIRNFIAKNMNARHLLIALAVMAVCLFAISPRMQFGTAILLDLNLPARLEEIASIFRASARLFWPIYYLIVTGVLAYIILRGRRKAPVILVAFLATFVFIQVVDIRFSKEARHKATDANTVSSDAFHYRPNLNIEAWGTYAHGKKHMVYLDGKGHEQFFDLADVALAYDLTLNTGYFARGPYPQILRYQEEQRKLLLNKQADVRSNLYVTQNADLARSLQNVGYKISKQSKYFIVSSSSEQ